MDDSPYTPLDQGLQEIRVLEIAPGAYDDDLVISLRTKTLQKKKPKFNALSYVWGKEKCSRKVLLNGRLVSIGHNLDGALRQLRSSMSGHLLWIDALCIDQQNIQERSQQVQLMGRVYSSANEVIIWLGPERKDDQYAIDMISRHQMPADANEAIQLMRVLKRICLRPWFGRVWVAQELALAQRSPLVQLGPRKVHWEDLCNYLKAMDSERSFRAKAEHWSSKSGYAYAQADQRFKLLDALRRNKTNKLTLQLGWANRLRATDPRDQIYGLLGICTFSSYRYPIVADYSKTIRQVFIEASCSMLLDSPLPYESFPLRPLPIKSLRASVAPVHLPTWAFDFTVNSHRPFAGATVNHPLRFLSRGSRHTHLAKSVSHLPPCLRFSANLEQLHTVGLHIGTISATSADLFYDLHPTDFSLRRLVTSVYDFYNDILKPRHILPSSYNTAFCFRGSPIDSDIFGKFLTERLRTGQIYTNQYDPSSDHFWGRALDALRYLKANNNRLMVVTEEGHLGTMYHPEPLTAVQPGDVVVGLFGTNFPFVLRPLPKEKDDEQLYTMVNIAYVVDHEYGHDFVLESGPEAKWEDFEKFGLREYTIV